MKNQTALVIKLSYHSYSFKGFLINDGERILITAVMQNMNEGLSIDEFVEQIQLSELSGILENIQLNKIIIKYQSDCQIYFSCFEKDGSSLTIGNQEIILKLSHLFSLNKLPLIGNLFASTDTINIKELTVEKTNQIDFSMEGILIIQNYEIPLCFHKQKKMNINDNKQKEEIHWIEIHKGIKSLQLNQVGFTFKNQMAYLYLDIDFHISFIQVSVLGLYLASDIPHFRKFDVGLLGLGIVYQSPTLKIGGSFEMISKDYYEGSIIIGFAKLLISAIGMYHKEDNQEHVFIYAALFYPLGGAPCFFITGLSLGVGVQYHLKMPSLENISQFPLLAYLRSKEVLKPKESFQKLKPYLSSKNDEYFFCVGIQATTFGLIKTEALLNIVVKPKLSITIIGTSQLDFPEKKALVHATLNFMATYNETEGSLKIIAALQSDSYIIDPACHLTGGFAIYTWFKGEHANDFVISVGGYHPTFERTRSVKYPHYPSLERVGINWIINSHVSISGCGYFALTPSCLMAGGNLSLVYQDGALKAWLIAYADFLIQWKPWAYDISMGISIGASYRIDFLFIHKTFTIELGAQVHLWGPDFQGEAKISWFIISFTIHFGNPKPIKQNLHFSDVEELIFSQNQNSTDDICQIKVTSGIQKEISSQLYQVDNEHLSFEVSTLIPVSRIEGSLNNIYTGKNIHVLPMNGKPLDSHMKIIIKNKNQKEYFIPSVPIYDNVSYALWGDKKTSIPNAKMILDTLKGVEFKADINVSELCLPICGTYLVSILNGLHKVYIHSYFTHVFSVETGINFPFEQQTYQNIQTAFKMRNEYKDKHINDFHLQQEYIEPFKNNNDFYHCQIHFQETGLDNL